MRTPTPVAVRRRPDARSALEDAHPEPQAGRPQPPGQARRVDHRDGVAQPDPAQVRRRAHLVLHLLAVEQHRVAAGLAGQPRRLGEVVDLPRRHRDVELAGALPAAVDAVPLQRLLDRVEVGPAEPLEPREVVRAALGAVGQPVRQARRAEAAVAPRRPPRRRRRPRAARRRVRGPPPWPAAPPTARCSRRRRRAARRSSAPSSGGSGSGRSAESSQYETGRASSRAARAVVTGPCGASSAARSPRPRAPARTSRCR